MAGHDGDEALDFEAYQVSYTPVRAWFAPAPDRDVETVELVFDDDGVRFVYLDGEGAESVDTYELPVE